MKCHVYWSVLKCTLRKRGNFDKNTIMTFRTVVNFDASSAFCGAVSEGVHKQQQIPQYQ